MGLEKPERPSLRVSADRTLAVNGSFPVRTSARSMLEVKEFYATLEVFESANEALANADSGVRLVLDKTTSITIDHGDHQRILFRIIPEADQFSDVCVELATTALGGQPETFVFRNPAGGVAVAPTNSHDPMKLTGTHALAASLANQDVRDTARDGHEPAWAVAQLTTNDNVLPGQQYGAALKGGELDGLAKKIGVNQGAWARPGESYVTSTIYATANSATQTNHASNAPAAESVYGYHFATVVAQSMDGTAQITLENYRRQDSFQRAYAKAVRETETREAEDLAKKIKLLQKLINTTGGDPYRSDLALSLYVQEMLAGTDRQNNERLAVKLIFGMAPLPAASSLWHFKMYTTRPGEGFHEQLATTYDQTIPIIVINPLTLVTTGGTELPKLQLTVQDGKLDKISVNQVKSATATLVKIVRWRTANEVPLPVATVSGPDADLVWREISGNPETARLKARIDTSAKTAKVAVTFSEP